MPKYLIVVRKILITCAQPKKARKTRKVLTFFLLVIVAFGVLYLNNGMFAFCFFSYKMSIGSVSVKKIESLLEKWKQHEVFVFVTKKQKREFFCDTKNAGGGEGKGAQLTVTPGRTIAATGSQLDPDGDLWWVDKNNQLSFHSLTSLLGSPCDENTFETRFRYYNNSGQVYVRMTPNWIFTEFWYPFVTYMLCDVVYCFCFLYTSYVHQRSFFFLIFFFWGVLFCSKKKKKNWLNLLNLSAQVLEKGINNLCYQCISQAGYASPDSYDFIYQRNSFPDNNCWDECIGNNTFLNTGDTDQDPIFSWAFFEARIYRDTLLTGQLPQEYRLLNDVDLQITHTFNRSMELVTVSDASVYSYINGQMFHIGSKTVTYVHGSWFRSWTNPSGNQWVSPFVPSGPKNHTCFTWIASKDDVTGKFGTLNAQYYVDKAGIVCPNITKCVTHTTASPTKQPTYAPTRFVSTAAPTAKLLPIINFTGIPCQTCNMDLFVIVDASKSISDDSLLKEKMWVQQLFQRIKREFDRMNAQMAALHFPDRVCFRAGIVTFSYLISMPMNLSMWDCSQGGYNATIGNQIISSIGRPHPPNTRLAGTHIRDALDGALLMYNRSNKTCTSFYGIALTDGYPQSYRQGPDTNQNPCLGGYRGTKFQNKLTNFFWVPVEGGDSYNTELFSCLLKPPTQHIITQSQVIPLMNWDKTTHPECQMCQTKLSCL
ncbi:hypothetical protein RFI_20639 [Reticulomyxa filosa]|uniref:VWFA domain-containing protein n=1 Tax=Reticulomyxa filosa TaxID=46433 RepID=X6MUA2_RETFI|nr:hypothetical protein RFI_20639 [Reticulomyxa filosa]|eukprot:ETO16700.1 hypothetical protein RFI_20639 [Reticulomyxa filosa]